jgi:hypothetical protein
MHLLRFILALMLAIQPGLCLAGTSCGASSGPVQHHDCCCGDACPAVHEQADQSISRSCDCCSSEQPAQPTPPSKTSNDGRLDFGAPVSPALVPVAVPATLAIKPQVRFAGLPNRSINALLCVWLT